MVLVGQNDPPIIVFVLQSTYFSSSFFMKSVNKAIVIGNVTREPELKKTTAGQSICTFGLATNRVWKTATGEKQSLAEFHNIVAWGGLADFCAQSVHKGKPLYIEGYLKTRHWEDDKGHKTFKTEIVVEDMVLLSPRAAESEHPAMIDEAPAPSPDDAQ